MEFLFDRLIHFSPGFLGHAHDVRGHEMARSAALFRGSLAIGLGLVPEDAEFLHPTAQSTRLKVEQLGRSLVALDPPVRLCEHGHNVLALDFFKRRHVAWICCARH